MANCGCSDTQQPCCNDCPESNPCESGCLDIIDATCIEYTSDLPSCISITDGSKLDFVIQAIDNEICALKTTGDKYVRSSSGDTVSGYLLDKISVCSKLTKTLTESGGQQQVHICLSDTAETDLSVADSASIDFSVSGAASHTLTGQVKISEEEDNPLFIDADGLNVDYTVLVNAIINNPTLLSAICTAIQGCP